jgi:glycosyltransferase involved in cell wall biosynthesis
MKDELGKKMGDVFLVTTSRLVHKNAIDDVISALPLLPENISFIIYGTGPEEEKLKTLAKELEVEDRVQFRGQITHEEMPLVLRACDIFIRPSRSEGMGNSFIEAMAAGLPVIGTQEGGITDFLFDERKNPDVPMTGWAVGVDSPEDIREAVQDILARREKREAIIATAKAMVQEKYDWDRVSGDMKEKVFDPILRKGQQ